MIFVICLNNVQKLIQLCVCVLNKFEAFQKEFENVLKMFETISKIIEVQSVQIHKVLKHGRTDVEMLKHLLEKTTCVSISPSGGKVGN